MTCDTSDVQGRGVAVALAEAELIWQRIFADAAEGELHPLYGAGEPWQGVLDPPPLIPPPESTRRRYAVQMLSGAERL